MDLSSISNTGIAVLSTAATGAIAMVYKVLDLGQKLAAASRELQQAKYDAQARRAVAVRAAREAAGGLEAFALACYALLIENARALRAGDDGISFRLPKFAPGVGVCDSAAALELESACRDLEQQVRSANDHIAETCRDHYHAGPEEALVVLEARAYETAAAALKLAGRYRKSFDVPRMRLGDREQRIEKAIFSRVAEEDAASPADH
ncbi:hypothetical protein [Burkholderia sp. BCC0405]|uniref:hypothetical protein n=1 Tax=Burkholderia sp. BCC0405 TaxID=2676298 RepID=UPI0015885920|nr:hypothetical protein [Burkholderia sp. BCC0405]